MKIPFYLSAIALTASLSSAQEATTPAAVQPAAEPVAEAVPVPVDSAAAPAVSEATEAHEAPVAEAATIPADSSTAAPLGQVAADSVAAPADSSTAAPLEQVAADSVAAPADSSTAVPLEQVAADSAVAQADSAVAQADSVAATPVAEAPAFVADSIQPPAPLVSGTKIKGNLNGFLKLDNSPYVFENDITVDKHSVLVVEPGVVLQFAPGAGLYVQGQLVVAGSRNSSVIFKSASSLPKSGDWKGIFIATDSPTEIRHALISGAENGIVIENSTLNLETVIIEKTTSRGVYAKNSKVSVSDGGFYENTGAALHISSYSTADIQRVKFEKNTVALFNSELAKTEVGSSKFEGNTYGLLDMGNSILTFNNTSVNKNVNGATSSEVLDRTVLESISDNTIDYTKDYNAVVAALPPNPEIPGVESRLVNPDDRIGLLVAEQNKAEAALDTTVKPWSIIGNVMLGGYYHGVLTKRSHKKGGNIVGNDTIDYHDHYKNSFQTPGFGAEASAYLLMQSPGGSTFEFKTDLTSDSWNHFSPNPVTLSYTDQHNHLVLGDFQKINGDIYMSSLPIFGAGYTLSLLKNNANQPMLELDGFFGEARRPYQIGDRHPDIYNDYIEDGEAQAQRIAVGGSIKWAPVRRFDATFGAIYANDEIKDPLLRDGGKSLTTTSEPMQESFTMYADGNWLFFPGDIELRGQIAVGRADTAEVYKERAVNKVFQEAGINYASYSQMRQLMKDERKIYRLTTAELEEIFGGNTTMSPTTMRDSLVTLLRKAKISKEETDEERDEDRVLGLNWGSQNFAIGASLYWNIYKTTISGHIKYVGEDFYSAGSADQLSDTREFGGKLEQIITNFWTLNFAYDLNVENAANGTKSNIFGLGEGTGWGFFSEATNKWQDEHELDNDRAKYIQNFNLSNNFKIGKNISLNVGYNLEYRTQYRPYQLHGDYILEDGIYQDSWFAARKSKPTTKIEDGDNVVEVDSLRWAEYMGLAGEPYLASKFQERIYKNTWNADVSIKAFKSIFKVGTRMTLRSDDSKFFKDSLIEDIELSDKTWSKLGYYFGGADFFEHTYPISVTTTLDRIQNRAAITPRFKSYERDDMSESEITLEDDFEISFLNRFLILGVNATFRYLSTSWENGSDDVEESETDVLGGVNLRINHTKRLSSEWYTGAAMYYRPDNLSDEYKDIYGGVRLNYVF